MWIRLCANSGIRTLRYQAATESPLISLAFLFVHATTAFLLLSTCLLLTSPDITIHSYWQTFIPCQFNTFILGVQSLEGDVPWLGDWFQTYKSNVLLLSPSITSQMARILNYTPTETSKRNNYISYLGNKYIYIYIFHWKCNLEYISCTSTCCKYAICVF
jgi:hypothetical protein